MRMFFLRSRTSTRALLVAGATITSVKTSATCSAISTVTGRLAAITPPKARDRIAGVGLAVGLGDVGSDGDAARVGVLDDGDARGVEVVGAR
jgi:Tfp pilus assembly protein PilZ